MISRVYIQGRMTYACVLAVTTHTAMMAQKQFAIVRWVNQFSRFLVSQTWHLADEQNDKNFVICCVLLGYTNSSAKTQGTNQFYMRKMLCCDLSQFTISQCTHQVLMRSVHKSD